MEPIRCHTSGCNHPLCTWAYGLVLLTTFGFLLHFWFQDACFRDRICHIYISFTFFFLTTAYLHNRKNTTKEVTNPWMRNQCFQGTERRPVWPEHSQSDKVCVNVFGVKSNQTVVVQSPSRVRLCDLIDCSLPGLPVPHHHLKFAQVHCIGDAIQPPHPLMPFSPSTLNLAQHEGLF